MLPGTRVKVRQDIPLVVGWTAAADGWVRSGHYIKPARPGRYLFGVFLGFWWDERNRLKARVLLDGRILRTADVPADRLEAAPMPREAEKAA